MKRKTILVLLCLLAGAILSACESWQAEQNARSTEIAASIFATQTAGAPTTTSTPTPMATSTLTATPTSTFTPTPTPGPITVRVTLNGSGDFPTLEAAVEAVYPGSTIMLAPGIYRLQKPLDIGKAIRLVGAGMDRTEIVSDAEEFVVRFTGKGLFAAEDITFRHEGYAAADVVVAESGEVAFARCRFIGADQWGAGLSLQGNTTGSVRDCEAQHNSEAGILIKEKAQVTLERNTCINGKAAGISHVGDRVATIRKNKCSNNRIGIYVGSHAMPTLTENVCTDNKAEGILYAESAGGTAQQNECSRNETGIKVQNLAHPTLVENLCTENKSNGILIQENAKAVLEKNTCNGNHQSGIVFWLYAGGIARQNECSRNGSAGIQIDGQAQPTIEGNVCLDNEQYGIIYAGGTSGTARENTCSGNMYGIRVTDTAQPTLEGNTCRRNTVTGITFDGDAKGTAHENKCEANALYGIYVGKTDFVWYIILIDPKEWVQYSSFEALGWEWIFEFDPEGNLVGQYSEPSGP